MAESLHLSVAAVNECLKVAFQVCPAPLQTARRADRKVSLRAIARDHAAELFAEQLGHHARAARRPQGKHGELLGHARPQPGLRPAFLAGRFVKRQLFLFGQSRRERLITRPQRPGGLSLQLHHPTRRAGLAKNLFEKQCDAAFRLSKATHQHRRERDQSRPRGARRHAVRQLAARRHATPRARQPMALILGDDRLDLRQFPHLMPPRVAIPTGQLLVAASAGVRFEHDDRVALFHGNQRPLVPRMTRLTAAIAFRLRLGRGRFGVRMLRGGRQRGILRRLAQPVLKFSHALLQRGNMRQQRANDRPRLRRLPCNHLLR